MRELDQREDGDKYRSNKTMYDDLKLGSEYRHIAQWYADQYRDFSNRKNPESVAKIFVPHVPTHKPAPL